MGKAAANVQPVTAPVTEDVRRINLFRTLNDCELGRVAAVGKVCHLRARTALGIGQKLPDSVASVLEGECQVVATAPNGASISLYRMPPGATYGVGRALTGYRATRASGLRVLAEVESTLLAINRADFAVLLKDMPSLHLACAKHQAELHVDLSIRYYELATLDVRARLLAELMRMAEFGERVCGRIVIDPAPTHAALGLQIGAAREAVTRHLLEFQRQGLINVGRRSVVIVDPARFQSLEEAAAGRRFFRPRRENETD
jgi:CRP-like cAMP-binding protein